MDFQQRLLGVSQDILDLLNGLSGLSAETFGESAQTFCMEFWDLDFLAFLRRLSTQTFWSLPGFPGLSAWTCCNNLFP